MNKKAQELSEWYAKLAENDNGWTISDGTPGCFGPRMESVLSRFTVNPPKPVKKIIDLSVCIKSGIDMEFKGACFWWVDKLVKIKSGKEKYVAKNSTCEDGFNTCRVRQDHWHSWQGGDCPIPEGLTGEILLRGKTTELLLTADKWRHHWTDIDSDIIAFKVTGIADGYRYEWMEE